MDKKCTLIAAALMVAGVFSANAQSSTTVPEAQWKAGNYYYLKTGSSVLSLSGEKADSVIVKTLASDATKPLLILPCGKSRMRARLLLVLCINSRTRRHRPFCRLRLHLRQSLLSHRA